MIIYSNFIKESSKRMGYCSYTKVIIVGMLLVFQISTTQNGTEFFRNWLRRVTENIGISNAPSTENSSGLANPGVLEKSRDQQLNQLGEKIKQLEDRVQALEKKIKTSDISDKNPPLQRKLTTSKPISYKVIEITKDDFSPALNEADYNRLYRQGYTLYEKVINNATKIDDSLSIEDGLSLMVLLSASYKTPDQVEQEVKNYSLQSQQDTREKHKDFQKKYNQVVSIVTKKLPSNWDSNDVIPTLKGLYRNKIQRLDN